MAKLADAIGCFVVLAVAIGLVGGLAWAAGQLRPKVDDGRRYEPPAVVGARVITEHGPGVITAEVRMGDGPAWQVRLESGRHVVLYRAEFHVLNGGF